MRTIAITTQIRTRMMHVLFAASVCSLLLCACGTVSMPTNTPSPFPKTPTPTPFPKTPTPTAQIVISCPSLGTIGHRDPKLPRFLEHVSPEPESTLRAFDYEGRSIVVVRFVIRTEEIVEPGDFFDVDDVLERGTLLLNGRTPETVSLGEQKHIMAEVQLAKIVMPDKEGNTIASWPGPLASRCWFVPLEPGKHEATVRVHKTSGAVLEYTWTFTIVP